MTHPDLPTGLRPRLVRRDPAALTRLVQNARYMRQEEYQRLVANLRRDGALTSVPLVYGGEYAEGAELILSGNHRCDAAADAGLAEIDVMLIDEPLSKDQLIALQLSHNAINGQDDPATLKALYEQIDEVDWRSYAGLDDKELALLDDVNLEGLSEANLDFQTVQVVFLPHERERARQALTDARTGADETWLAARADYEPALDALASTHAAHNVGNVATAFGLILDVVENHLADLQTGYLDADGAARHKKPVGWETVFGVRTLPAESAAVITRALRKAERAGDVDPAKPWELLSGLAETYLNRGAR